MTAAITNFQPSRAASAIMRFHSAFLNLTGSEADLTWIQSVSVVLDGDGDLDLVITRVFRGACSVTVTVTVRPRLPWGVIRDRDREAAPSVGRHP